MPADSVPGTIDLTDVAAARAARLWAAAAAAAKICINTRRHTHITIIQLYFIVSGPTVWNSLPAALRLNMSRSVFRTRLKTFLMT